MSKLNTSQTLQTTNTVSTKAPSGFLQRKCASCGTHTIAGDKCEDCDNIQGGLQRKSSKNVEQPQVPPIVHEVLSSTGQPLDKTTRAFFESRFAHNFSGVSISSNSQQMSYRHLTIGEPSDAYEQEADRAADSIMSNENGENKALPANRRQGEKFDLSRVRIHTDARAAASAHAVNALAYTVGNNIVFGAGQFAPGTHKGRRLIAHELTHVVQQTGSHNARAGESSGKSALSKQSISSAKYSVQREGGKPSGEATVVYGAVFYIPNVGLGDEVEKELLRQGILKPEDYSGRGFLGEGYYFSQTSGAGPTFKYFRVMDAIYIKDENDKTTGYKIISYLQRHVQGKPAAPDSKTESAEKAPAEKAPATPKKSTTTPKKSKPKDVKPPSSEPAPTTSEAEKPTPKTSEQMRAELKALPEPIKALLGDESKFIEMNYEQLLRIAEKLKKLQPEDLQMYKLLATKLADDLDSFERSVDFYIKFKEQLKEQAQDEKTKQTSNKEPTLEEKLAKTWDKFDEKKFGGMNTSQKEDLARQLAAEQRDIQLEHMATHPGETLKGMAEGVVRVDKTAKAIAEDVKEAADGSKSATSRLAGGVGAVNKTVAAVASIVFIALLFVPGVNLVELAVAGLAVAVGTMVLSAVESELRIKAASETKNPEEFKTHTSKSAAAQANLVMTGAMIALMLVMKLVARIPLRGRYQNVGEAFNAAQKALIQKSGVGLAWQSVKTELLNKLRGAKKGLPEALAEQSKVMTETAKAVEGMSDGEFINQLAEGDPKLAELGVSPEQAKAVQQVAATPEGKGVPAQLRQDALKALQDAPVEAGKKVDQFLQGVDDSIEKIDKAQSQEQLKSAVDEASGKMSAEEQAKQAISDEQGYVKGRVESARRKGIREQAQKKLEKLHGEKAATDAEILRLEKELFDARAKVAKFKDKALNDPDPEVRAQALKDFKAAKKELETLLSEDELGGYREERAKQNKAEDALLESLKLTRPTLWEATKKAIRDAAQKKDGKYLDANTGEVIQGEPVYGHKYGKEHRRLVLEATEKGMTQEQFTQWVNDHPDWFQTETKANNESHRFEKPGVD
jgi:Domain of unknown function (DUF4157)/HNH/ENDO VII superfamily nuclease with conserved GHE residues